METGDILNMTVWVQRKQVYVNVTVKPAGKRRHLLARFVLERSSDPVDDDVEVVLATAAYAAGARLKS